MKSFLKRLTGIYEKAFKGSLYTKGIVVGVLCAIMICIFTGITIASKTVYIKDQEKTYVAYTLSNDPLKILDSQDIQFDKNDKIVYNELDDNKAEIIIKRSFNVYVTADNQTRTVSLADGTVADALAQAQVSVNPDDRLNLPLDESVMPNSNIIVDRVTKSVSTRKSKIRFKTVKKKSSAYLKGERIVKVKGRHGIAVTKRENVFVNGVLESSKIVSKTVSRKPIKRIVLVGTKKAIGVDKLSGAGTIIYNGKKLKYSKKLVGSGTAYTAHKGAKTSTGRKVARGVVAVNPNVIPYGTKLFIKTENGSFIYGKAIAGDTGGALASGAALVDLYFDTESECYRFGRRQVEVYVLE